MKSYPQDNKNIIKYNDQWLIRRTYLFLTGDTANDGSDLHQKEIIYSTPDYI